MHAYVVGNWRCALLAVAAQLLLPTIAVSPSEAFLDEARRAYATEEFAGYTNTVVRSILKSFKVKKTDGADRPTPGGRIGWHHVEGMRNVRDIGGWNGLPTGRVFRGSEPDCLKNDDPKKYHGLVVTDEGRRVMQDVLKIKTDLDLRSTKECPHPEYSSLGVRLVRVPISAYTNAFRSVKGYAAALRVFADPANYPIYFHCYGGADRTGTLAFLVEGLCGVSEADLSIDYELTSFCASFGIRARNAAKTYPFPQFVARLKEYPGKTLSDKIAAYMETTLGLSADEIAAIRRNVMECSDSMACADQAAERALSAPSPGGVLSLSPGMHELDATAVLGREWSNVTVRSVDPERPATISGGRRVTGWKIGEDGVWRVELPEVKSGEWNFSTLYVNGIRRTRPTIPDEGYLETVSNAFVEGKSSIGGFAFRPGDISAGMANISDVEVFVLHTWCTTRARIGMLDTERGILRLATPRESTYVHFDFTRRRYRLENVKEAFSKAGTWYLDRPSGVLSYRPLPGETPSTAVVVVPRLETLVRMDGAEGLRFENVRFSFQNLVTPKAGRFAVQAGWNVPAAVEVTSSRDISFVRCGFMHTDGYALDISADAAETTVDGSYFCDLGAGGVRAGSFDHNKTQQTDMRGMTVRNCRITDGGNVFPEGVGVLIGRSSYNTVVSNEIDRLRYSGVSVGWDWHGRKPSFAHHNEIAFNHIHDIGLGVLSDMGMIYLLGRSPGTTVHDNNLHDIKCFTHGGIGIYPDQGTSEVKIWNNLVRNTMRGYYQNYGEGNETFNNIFVNSGVCQWNCRPEKGVEGDCVNMHHNIFVWKEGDFFRRELPFGMTSKQRAEWNTPAWQGFSSDSNILWRIDGKVPDFCGMPFAEWVEKSGQERGSFVGNPGFSGDVFSGDCSLLPDSPAIRLGFKPFTPPTTR